MKRSKSALDGAQVSAKNGKEESRVTIKSSLKEVSKSRNSSIGKNSGKENSGKKRASVASDSVLE